MFAKCPAKTRSRSCLVSGSVRGPVCNTASVQASGAGVGTGAGADWQAASSDASRVGARNGNDGRRERILGRACYRQTAAAPHPA